MWDGATWSERFPSAHPRGRANFGMDYDSGLGRVVVFGGNPGSQALLNDTWTWNGASWARLRTATSPPPRAGLVMSYDRTRGEMVMFGGTSSTAFLGDTWTLQG